MWGGIRDNARTIRALIAVCAAATLCIVLFMQEQARANAKERAIYLSSATLWKMSELIFETQRLSNTLQSYAMGDATKADVNLRFDILWSRMDVLGNSAAVNWGPVLENLETHWALLLREEPFFIDDTPIGAEDIDRLVAVFETVTLDARRNWTQGFVGRSPAIIAISEATVGEQSRQYIGLATALISLLMLYVLAEVFFATRAQRRQRILHEKAAQASAAKSRFLANVSHEIRTPLNGILGMTSELSETELTQEQALCLGVIEQSGGVLLSTINDVLDFSKVEEGVVEIEAAPFDIGPMLDAACALYSAKARAKRLELSVELDPALPRRVIGDERRLRQVLHNLIANAVKFTETGGVRVSAVPGDAPDEVDFLVRDTGPGVTPEKRDDIFEPFTQADGSITRTYGGTGLGLAISRQLCEAMGGSLTLVEENGPGSCFRGRLPLPAAPERRVKRSAQLKELTPDLSGWEILIADDNATNRLILSRFLKPTGANLTTARDGCEAVESAAKTRFDVILMDIQMPRMDGVAATRLIREAEAERRLAPTRITAVTANVFGQQVEQYQAAGIDDVLGKPVSKADLFASLAGFAATRQAA